MMLEEFRRRYVEQVLQDHGGNVIRAARASGVGRRYFQRIKAKRDDKG
jgi:ActR/RegA family two-component response regulator